MKGPGAYFFGRQGWYLPESSKRWPQEGGLALILDYPSFLVDADTFPAVLAFDECSPMI